MKKLRLTIYILLFTFNIFLFIMTLIIENIEIFKLASWILPKIPFMKYGALVGITLVIIDYIVDKAEKKILIKEAEKIQNELNGVKAKLFDMQQTTTSTAVDTGEAPESTKED